MLGQRTGTGAAQNLFGRSAGLEMATSSRARWVVPIDRSVRRAIILYVRLFPNYAAAARDLHVSKDTLAKYVSGSANMALPVFRRLASRLARSYDPQRLSRELEGLTLQDIVRRAHPSNLRQTDHVGYVITPQLRTLLLEYARRFPNRAQAAFSLEINPRTFKAYLSGQIETFPRSKFRKLLAEFRRRGASDESLLRMLEAPSWSAILVKREKVQTLDLTPSNLVQSLVPYFERGTLETSAIDRRLINAARRIHGSIGAALSETMAALAERQRRRVRRALRTGRIDLARNEICRWESYLRVYARKAASIDRALPRSRKRPWRSEICRLVRDKEEVKDELRRIEAVLRPAWVDPTSRKRLAGCPSTVKIYDPGMEYRAGDRLIHPVFGCGKVLKIEHPGRMTVLFAPDVGIMRLVFGEFSESCQPTNGKDS